MLRSTLKFRILQKLFFHIVVTILLFIALAISMTLSLRTEVKKENVEYSLDEAKKESDELGKLIVKYKTNAVDWNKGIKDLYIERNGLNLDLAKKVIEELRVVNNITNISINITKPVSRENIGPLKFTKLIHALMNITLQAPSDKDILKFVTSLSGALPGVLKFINMQMFITGEGANQIINAKIEFQWQNLEDAS